MRELYELWRGAFVDDLPPTKAAFPIQELPFKMWQYLTFCNYTEDRRFFNIHNGTAVVRYFGREATGKYVDDYLPIDFASAVLPIYNGVMEEGSAVYYEGDLMTATERFLTYARLLMPVRAVDEDRNGHLLGLMLKISEHNTYDKPYHLRRRNVIWENPDVNLPPPQRRGPDRGTLSLI